MGSNCEKESKKISNNTKYHNDRMCYGNRWIIFNTIRYRVVSQSDIFYYDHCYVHSGMWIAKCIITTACEVL